MDFTTFVFQIDTNSNGLQILDHKFSKIPNKIFGISKKPKFQISHQISQSFIRNPSYHNRSDIESSHKSNNIIPHTFTNQIDTTYPNKTPT